jgi:uncharacterized protein (TIGR03067 family)
LDGDFDSVAGLELAGTSFVRAARLSVEWYHCEACVSLLWHRPFETRFVQELPMNRLVCFAFILFCATLASAQEKAAPEKQPLLGEWVVVQEKTAGGLLATNLRENVTRVAIDSDAITAGRKASYLLKVSESPKQIDLTIDDGGPKAEQGTYLGIYELTGDALKIHLAPPGQPRPGNFEAKPTTILIALTKSKKG